MWWLLQAEGAQEPASRSLCCLLIPETVAGPGKDGAPGLVRGSNLSKPALQPLIPGSEPRPGGRGGPLAGFWWGVDITGSLWGENPKTLCKACRKVR